MHFPASTLRRVHPGLPLPLIPALAICLTGLSAVPAAAEQATRGMARPQLRDSLTAPLFFSREAVPVAPRSSMGDGPAAGAEAALPGWRSASRPATSALLARYRQALMRESRRLLDKDASLLWLEPDDEEGYPERRARREAERIFTGANNRVASQFLQELMASTAALRAARDYIEGVRLDVLRDGGVRVRGSRDDGEAGRGAAASISVLIAGTPRLEMRTDLPGGVRARVELPLSEAGMRATLSRRLGGGVRGTLAGGVEESGDDRWVSAGLEIRF